MRGPSLLVFLMVVLGVSLSSGACEQSEHDAELVSALETMVTALEQEDWDTVWAHTSTDSQARLIDLHTKLHAALQVVDRTVAPADLPAAQAALGRDLVGGIEPGEAGIGPRLLSRMLTSEALRLDDHARDGLRIRVVQFEDDRATIETIAGEAFTFSKTEDGWRSRLVSDILDETGVVDTYLGHATTVTEHAAAHRRAWRENTDPKQPQGAYNLARAALLEKPVDARSLFAFFDDASRSAMLKAIERSRDVQRSVQRRVDAHDRIAAYKKRGLWHYVRAGSDRQLYMYWAEEKSYEAPFVTRANPARVELSNSDDRATVHTDDGGTVTFARAADGTWKFADQSNRLLKLLWEPMDRAYERMARPPQYWKYKD